MPSASIISESFLSSVPINVLRTLASKVGVGGSGRKVDITKRILETNLDTWTNDAVVYLNQYLESKFRKSEIHTALINDGDLSAVLPIATISPPFQNDGISKRELSSLTTDELYSLMEFLQFFSCLETIRLRNIDGVIMSSIDTIDDIKAIGFELNEDMIPIFFQQFQQYKVHGIEISGVAVEDPNLNSLLNLPPVPPPTHSVDLAEMENYPADSIKSDIVPVTFICASHSKNDTSHPSKEYTTPQDPKALTTLATAEEPIPISTTGDISGKDPVMSVIPSPSVPVIDLSVVTEAQEVTDETATPAILYTSEDDDDGPDTGVAVAGMTKGSDEEAIYTAPAPDLTEGLLSGLGEQDGGSPTTVTGEEHSEEEIAVTGDSSVIPVHLPPGSSTTAGRTPFSVRTQLPGEKGIDEPTMTGGDDVGGKSGSTVGFVSVSVLVSADTLTENSQNKNNNKDRNSSDFENDVDLDLDAKVGGTYIDENHRNYDGDYDGEKDDEVAAAAAAGVDDDVNLDEQLHTLLNENLFPVTESDPSADPPPDTAHTDGQDSQQLADTDLFKASSLDEFQLDSPPDVPVGGMREVVEGGGVDVDVEFHKKVLATAEKILRQHQEMRYFDDGQSSLSSVSSTTSSLTIDTDLIQTQFVTRIPSDGADHTVAAAVTHSTDTIHHDNNSNPMDNDSPSLFPSHDGREELVSPMIPLDDDGEEIMLLHTPEDHGIGAIRSEFSALFLRFQQQTSSPSEDKDAGGGPEETEDSKSTDRVAKTETENNNVLPTQTHGSDHLPPDVSVDSIKRELSLALLVDKGKNSADNDNYERDLQQQQEEEEEDVEEEEEEGYQDETRESSPHRNSDNPPLQQSIVRESQALALAQQPESESDADGEGEGDVHEDFAADILDSGSSAPVLTSKRYSLLPVSPDHHSKHRMHMYVEGEGLSVKKLRMMLGDMRARLHGIAPPDQLIALIGVARHGWTDADLIAHHNGLRAHANLVSTTSNTIPTPVTPSVIRGNPKVLKQSGTQTGISPTKNSKKGPTDIATAIASSPLSPLVHSESPFREILHRTGGVGNIGRLSSLKTPGSGSGLPKSRHLRQSSPPNLESVPMVMKSTVASINTSNNNNSNKSNNYNTKNYAPVPQAGYIGSSVAGARPVVFGAFPAAPVLQRKPFPSYSYTKSTPKLNKAASVDEGTERVRKLKAPVAVQPARAPPTPVTKPSGTNVNPTKAAAHGSNAVKQNNNNHVVISPKNPADNPFKTILTKKSPPNNLLSSKR